MVAFDPGGTDMTCPISWRASTIRRLVALFAVATAFVLGAAVGVEAEPMGRELRASLGASWTGDYDGMVARRTVRALVPLSRMFLYYDRNELHGLSVETLRDFEKQINKGRSKLEHVTVHLIPTPRDHLVEDLVAGRGDIAVGNLTITPERRERVDFGAPFLGDVRELVATGAKAAPIAPIDDLAGRRITVRRASSYHDSLRAVDEILRGRGRAGIDIVEADPWLEDEDLFEMVDAGLIEATVADEHKFEAWSRVHPELVAHRAAPVRSGGETAWAFRRESPLLKQEVDRFVATARKGTEAGNIAYATYVRGDRWLARAEDPTNIDLLKRLAGHFETYGERYGIDPYLLAAVAFQESHFDHRTKSRAGARGLMQMMPAIARDRNVALPDIADLETNVHAFAKYFAFLRRTYVAQPEMSEHDRMMILLASYNAGPERIKKLRRTARDPNVWAENVEWAVWKSIGFETVRYVGQVQKYYVVFRDMIEGLKLRRAVSQRK